MTRTEPWRELFDRAAAYDVSTESIREELGDRRAGDDG